MLMSPQRILTCERYLTTEKDLCPIIHKSGSEHRVWGTRNTLQTSSCSHQHWEIIQENTKYIKAARKERILNQRNSLVWSVTVCIWYLKALLLQNAVLGPCTDSALGNLLSAQSLSRRFYVTVAQEPSDVLLIEWALTKHRSQASGWWNNHKAINLSPPLCRCVHSLNDISQK